VTREFARHGGGEYEDVPLDDEKQSMRAWFGFAEPFDWRKRSYLGPLLSVVGILIVGGLFFLAIAAAFKLLGSAVFGSLPNGAGSSFGLTGIIVAMIGAPFVVWRAVVAQKQVDVAEQGQITDRISKAVEGLGAEKAVKNAGRETTKPNLEVRIGAIYALERIAQDSLRDHIQIMEILCAYIRENAPLRETPKNPFEIRKEKMAERDAIFTDIPGRIEMKSWSNSLPKPRIDVQVALEVIGRRQQRQIKVERGTTVRGSSVGYRLDLSETCLQSADLSELDFSHAHFEKAQIQGSDLSRANLLGTNLMRAELQGADLGWTNLQAARLLSAQMHGADLRYVQLQRAQLRGAQMFKTRLFSAYLQGARLYRAQLQGADLRRTKLMGAQLAGAALHGADFRNSQLQGADLALAKFDDLTHLGDAIFRGAALKDVNFTDSNISPEQLVDMFADATITLPGGHGPDHQSWPKHWNKSKLSMGEFRDQWRAFQASIGQDPKNPT